MFDCADQQTNRGRIPSNLLDLYVQYKQDTRTIIAWLVSHGTNQYKCSRTLSIRDLLGLAEIVQTKAVEMPDTLHFHFREVIFARTQLSRFFRGDNLQDVDDQETSNHEHFTTSLKRIYTGLCECCSKPRNQCVRSRTTCRSETNTATPSNRFTTLTVGCHDYDCPSNDEPHDCPCDVPTNCVQPKQPSPHPAPPILADDRLGEAFELCKELQEMGDLLAATENTWEQAAQGKIPIVVATFITSTAFATFEGIEQRLETCCNILDPEVLRNNCSKMEQDFGPLTSEGDILRWPTEGLVEHLQDSWHLLLNMRGEGPANQCEKASSASQPLSHLVLRKGSDSTSTDHDCLKFTLQNIVQHLQSPRSLNGILRVGTPVSLEMQQFFIQDGSDNNSLRCTFGLQLLLASYKSYLLALDPAKAPHSCRLQALKLAQEAVPSLRAVLDDSTMPCRCHGTLAYHLESLHHDLEDFLQLRNFDFYFQSPWVSGSHILEMLDALFYYGIRLLSHRNYVVSVVHVYNVLRQFTDLEAIPLLENLSTKFSDILFPGSIRPCRNFRACHIRSMGGRLHFHSHASGHHKLGCHSMVIPAHIAKATAGFSLSKESNNPGYNYRKISLLHHIKNQGYHPDNETWHRIYSLANNTNDILLRPKKATRKGHPYNHHHHHHHHHHHRDSHSPYSRLQTLQSALLSSSFSPPFPTAKVNFLKIYLACVRIISQISERRGCTEKHCLCFVDAMLAAADRCREHEGMGAGMGCKELVDICRDVMGKEMGSGTGVEEWLWGVV